MMKKLLFTLLCVCCAGMLQAQGGSVCGEIYNDLNGDGILNDGEPGVAGILISIITAPATEDFIPETTDQNGNYCFTNLSPGTYTFMIEVPQGWVISGSQNIFTIEVTDDSVHSGYRYGLTHTMAASKYQTSIANIYPNPTVSFFNLHLVNPKETGEIKLFDPSGKQLLKQQFFNADTRVNISSLPAGMYIVQLVTKDKINATKLVVLE